MNLDSIDFTQPLWFWMIPALAALSLLFRKLGTADDDIGLAEIAPETRLSLINPMSTLIPAMTGARSRKTGQQALHWAVLSLLTIALASPVQTGERLPDPPENRDIHFIVDSSISMMLRDYVLDGKRVDRMSVLKQVLLHFTDGLKGERISITVFGNQAYTLVPLTRDQQLIQHMIRHIEPSIAGRYNAMGDAIALAVSRASQHRTRRQVLVLLTDADTDTGFITPHTAAQLSQEAGLPLYTVAIGSGDRKAEEERLVGLVYEPADLELLQQMSEKTGASSYQARDTQALEQAIKAIEQLEKTPVKVEPRYYREPLYHWPLLLALLLITSVQVISLVRGQRP